MLYLKYLQVYRAEIEAFLSLSTFQLSFNSGAP